MLRLIGIGHGPNKPLPKSLTSETWMTVSVDTGTEVYGKHRNWVDTGLHG